jgi:hypothetical protein
VGEINLVMAREPIPTGPSVFLAGPTPERGSGVPSWRPDAVDNLEAQWSGEQPLTVLSPESRGGVRAVRYEDQFQWELRAREAATVILFWIPRDVVTMPGFTTNVEFGFDIAKGRSVVLGCPPGCPNPERNRYLVALAHMAGAPVAETLVDAAMHALQFVTGTA